MPTADELAERGENIKDWRLTVEHEDDIPGSGAGVKLTFPDSGVDDIEVVVRIYTDGHIVVLADNADLELHAASTVPERA